MFFKSTFLLLLIPMCLTQAPLNSRATQEFTLQNADEHFSKIWKNDKQNITTGFRIRLPFMDMDIETNKNLFVIQERIQKETIFLLHGNELFEMFVDRDEKRLSLIGFLGGKIEEMELLGGELISWREYYVLVIASEDYLEVFQFSKTMLENRAKITKDPKRRNETAKIFEPIQQILLTGKYRHHFLMDPDKDHIMLIVGINFTKLYGHLHTYLWSNSYFEPIEELTVPPIHKLYTVGTRPKYLIRGRIIQHSTKTIVTVHKIQSPSMTLQTIQTFTVNSRDIHVSSFRNKNYLIACSSKQKQCNSFLMDSEGRYAAYKHRSSNDLAFDKFVGGKNFLVASRQNEVLIYTSGRLDCYASFSTNDTDISSILTLVNNHDENFVLLNYKRPFRTLVRFIEIETEGGDFLAASAGFNGTDTEDTNSLFRHRHMFEETIRNLQSILLKRRSAMLTFRKISSEQKGELSDLNILHPVRINSGNINRIRLVDQNLLSPLQLIHRMAIIRQKFVAGRKKRETRREPILPTHLKVKHLNVKNLIYDGTVLDGFHLDQEARPFPILSARPKVTTKTLITQKLMTAENFNTPHHKNSTFKIKKFENLNVESINNLNWSEFLDSVFLKSRDTSIEGNITFKAPMKILNFTTISLNERSVENLFNLERPQVVHSNVHFFGFLIKELHAETVNGLDFANDIVYQNDDGLIESRVNMHHLGVMEDLLFHENVTIARQSNEDGNEFKQFYGGRVVINGSLTVRNIGSEEMARIMVNKKVFSKDNIKLKYLLRNENQIFNSTLIFGNAKITVPSLNTTFLNDHLTEEHLFVDKPKMPVKEPVMLVFMNSQIEGDLKIESFPTRIANLSRNAIRRGDVANITGTKTFIAPLNVEHLMTLSLNELPITELVIKSQLKREYQFNGKKLFKNIFVDNVTNVTKALNATYLNRLPIHELFNNDYHVDRLVVPFKLQVGNIIFHQINEISFNEIFNNFTLRDGQLVLHKDLLIDGNVNFVEDLNVENINGINWNEYQGDLVRRNDNAIIVGKKYFLNELTITKTLKTPKLNNLIMEEIFGKILSKSKAQIIKGIYDFENVKFTNLDVEIVNDIPTNEFIDSRQVNITIESDIIVPKIIVSGDIETTDESDLLNLRSYSEEIKNITNRSWRNIVVLHNANWNEINGADKMQIELLDYLQRNAVKRNGEQIITGNVKFINPFIKNMRTKSALSEEIDFDFIAKDCVFRNSNETQQISSKKSFSKMIQIQNVQIISQLRTQMVNDIDILKLNSSLYRLSSNEPIIGPIHFHMPLKIGQLIVEGLVNGINPSIIYHNTTLAVPIIKLNQLFVHEDLKIDHINDIDLNFLLMKRIPKNSLEQLEISGILSFENLILNESVLVQSINGIPLDKVVFKKSEKLQAIIGPKVIQGNLILDGPIHVLRLNDDDLIESYQQSIFINRNYHYEKLNIYSATFEKGLIYRKMEQPLLGAIALDNKRHSELVKRFKDIDNELINIENTLSSNSKLSKNFLYLDYAKNWNILWQVANVSIQKSFTYELDRSSSLSSSSSTLCERRFINVQIAQRKVADGIAGTVFLSNATKNFITKFAHNVSVKAENFCQQNNRKVKSKITIEHITSNFTKVIGMKKYIENIIIYSPINQSEIFILLHTIDWNRNQYKVRILKMTIFEEQNLIDCETLTLGIGKTLSLFEYGNYTVLISGNGGVLNNHSTLAIYHFDIKIQKFKFVQFIDGDFDIHELLPIKSESDFQLILTCHQCQLVHIYTYNAERVNIPYEIFQILKLKTLIGRVNALKLTDNSIYLMFLAAKSQHYFYLYRFSQSYGWLQETYGYLDNTQIALSLSDDDLELGNPSLVALLCGVNNCSLVQAIVV